jgi:hypothetical protein
MESESDAVGHSKKEEALLRVQVGGAGKWIMWRRMIFVLPPD